MEQKGYIITFNSQNNITVNTDKTLLMQVFYNLVNNALTYTGADKQIYVSQSVSEESKRVRISVTDTGDGIAPDKLHLIWDRYYKVDKVHKEPQSAPDSVFQSSAVLWIYSAVRTVFLHHWGTVLHSGLKLNTKKNKITLLNIIKTG